MIVQIGTDIVEIEKLKYSVTKEPFAQTLLSGTLLPKKKSGLHFYGLIRCLFLPQDLPERKPSLKH